jgi:hypothetical protein
MNRYFVISESTDSSIIGPSYPQCTGFLRGYLNERENKRSLYYFADFKGEKIDFIPDISAISVKERTKMTDLISCPLGPGNDKVISEKFYTIIQKVSKSRIQFFDCILNKKNEKFRYKWVHFIYNLEKYVDYRKTTFFHPDMIIFDKTKKIKSYKDFIFFYDTHDTYGFIRSEKTCIKHKPLDFFVAGRFNQKCYVSENLKSKIESIGLTGIEFILAKDIVFI